MIPDFAAVYRILKEASVTRCWNKKKPHYPKSSESSLILKSLIKITSKLAKYVGCLSKKCCCQDLTKIPKGAFTQSVLRGVIRRRLGYLIKKIHLKMTILRGVFCLSVNATSPNQE